MSLTVHMAHELYRVTTNPGLTVSPETLTSDPYAACIKANLISCVTRQHDTQLFSTAKGLHVLQQLERGLYRDDSLLEAYR